MKTFVLDFVACLVAVYLSIAFVKLNGNLLLWSESERLVLLFIAAVMAMLAQIVRRGW
jgi:hypothetical protein